MDKLENTARFVDSVDKLSTFCVDKSGKFAMIGIISFIDVDNVDKLSTFCVDNSKRGGDVAFFLVIHILCG